MKQISLWEIGDDEKNEDAADAEIEVLPAAEGNR